MRIALLQLNFTVADIAGNVARLEAAVQEAGRRGADLCVASELAVSGYPPRDLLLRPGFVAEIWDALRGLASRLENGPALLAGLPVANASAVGNPVFNAAALARGGRVEAVFHKNLLPAYDVFDERRYFEAGEGAGWFELGGLRLGVTICEDIWNDTDFWREHRYYARDPVEELTAHGVDCLLNLSASPFTLGKLRVREAMLSSMAAKHRTPIVYVNQVGGNDDLVFDGHSLAVDHAGRLCLRAPGFVEDIVCLDLPACGGTVSEAASSREEEAWAALVLGTRDYVKKCGFSRAVIGLSGGVDSALTAAIAVEALGAENVTGVLMPSPYSSRGSVDDALDLARGLGIATHTLPIADIMAAFDAALAAPFAGRGQDVTDENIQSRIRGALLMAFSNKFGSMLLTTGNKSELAVGYCTIYGDMNGGLAVIADLPKTMVYTICRWLNERRPVIPRAILDKPPSAELRPGQLDQDSLPPYDVLDAILERCIERHEQREEIVAAGFDSALVDKVLRLVRIAEFKRRQAPPGIKVTDRAFGTGWRMPIARS